MRDKGEGMKEYYCKVNEAPKKTDKVEKIAQYLLNEVCSNYEYTWEIIQVRSGEEGRYLQEGYEPFGVTVHHGSYQFLNTSLNRMETQLINTNYIHLRKKVKEIVEVVK